MGGGGFQGGQQGQFDRSTAGIQNQIQSYLTGKEVQNILTPGEFSEWPLTLKAGQVVIAEARSEAFDPALQIVDDKGVVLAFNDDRYPGDQRPLLLWRCEKAGSYSIRARCFHDKSGGQFWLRSNIYDSVDLGEVKQEDAPFLVRVPLKAGQIKQVFFDNDASKYSTSSLSTVIGPTGLPDIRLSRKLADILQETIMGSVDGDYYVLSQPYGKLPVHPIGKEIVSTPLNRAGSKGVASNPELWTLDVKAGEILKISTPELSAFSRMMVTEKPDTSKYSLAKSETNPFFPRSSENEEPKSPIEILPAILRDGRVLIIAVKRDATLWVGTTATGKNSGPFTIKVDPATKAFTDSQVERNHLEIGATDYWAFEAKAGDVMSFKSKGEGFAESIDVLDPDLANVVSWTEYPDQDGIKWNMTLRKPGRYLVAVTSVGGGGGGDYTLSRTTYHAKDIVKGTPVQGEITAGQVQVWRITVTPDQPLLMKWKSSVWNYGIQITDENGDPRRLPLTMVNGRSQYGILTVDKPTTFLIVLSGGGEKSQYTIELTDLPPFAKGG